MTHTVDVLNVISICRMFKYFFTSKKKNTADFQDTRFFFCLTSRYALWKVILWYTESKLFFLNSKLKSQFLFNNRIWNSINQNYIIPIMWWKFSWKLFLMPPQFQTSFFTNACSCYDSTEPRYVKWHQKVEKFYSCIKHKCRTKYIFLFIRRVNTRQKALRYVHLSSHKRIHTFQTRTIFCLKFSYGGTGQSLNISLF